MAGSFGPQLARLGARLGPEEGAPGFPEPGRATIYSARNSAALFQASKIPGGEQAPSWEGASRSSSRPLFNTVFNIFPTQGFTYTPKPSPWPRLAGTCLFTASWPPGRFPFVSPFGRAENWGFDWLRQSVSFSAQKGADRMDVR